MILFEKKGDWKKRQTAFLSGATDKDFLALFASSLNIAFLPSPVFLCFEQEKDIRRFPSRSVPFPSFSSAVA